MRGMILMAAALFSVSPAAMAQPLDVVLKGGLVVDPETGLEAVREVGVRGGRIVEVSQEPLEGARVIDATGLVVAPGFVDLHQHQFDQETLRLKALDGVTMALELEGGVPDLGRFIEVRSGASPIHFGTAACHICARVAGWQLDMPSSVYGPATTIQDPPPDSSVINDPATPEQLDRLLGFLRAQLEEGALGVGIGLEYTPGATRFEIIEVFRLAAEYARPVFVHIRNAGTIEPGSSIESMGEVIGAAAVSGAPLHVVHVNSMCAAQSPECLRMVEGARARGLDVTVEAYPWTAFSTLLNSALFNPGWRERDNMDYGDLELPGTGERLTEELFHRLRASSEPVVIIGHQNPPHLVDEIIRHPLVTVASDGLRGHPRNAGTFARVLARYVRDQRTLTLMDAVRKMSLAPAQRLEASTPAARRKGRLQVGADADMVVFDPETIAPLADYGESLAPSTGVQWLLVGGVPVVEAGEFVEGVYPGEAFGAD